MNVKNISYSVCNILFVKLKCVHRQTDVRVLATSLRSVPCHLQYRIRLYRCSAAHCRHIFPHLTAGFQNRIESLDWKLGNVLFTSYSMLKFYIRLVTSY